jgi:hypothetical protein
MRGFFYLPSRTRNESRTAALLSLTLFFECRALTAELRRGKVSAYPTLDLDAFDTGPDEVPHTAIVRPELLRDDEDGRAIAYFTGARAAG